MTSPQSPTRFNGYEDDPIFIQANFTQDINDKMRVPKRIKATGEYSDDDHLLSNQNGMMNSWNYRDKIDMNVPDRILVIGQNQHLGTRSAPREIILENSILPNDPGLVRVATPPRILTLNEHHFPSATDEPELSPEDYLNFNKKTTTNNIDEKLIKQETDNHMLVKTNQKSNNYNDSFLLNRTRDDTQSIYDLPPDEEILHLRKQLAKLNRRVLNIEMENSHRQQRDKMIYCLGLAYFLLKTFFWLNKN